MLTHGRRCLTPPRRPALAILRKPASGTSTFPIRNALTISAKRLQSGRKHSFVIVDALCPCPTSPRRHVFCTQLPRCVILDASQPRRFFSFHLPPIKRLAQLTMLASCRMPCGSFAWTAVTTPAVDNVGHRANRVSQRQMGNRWPYQL